MILFIKRLIWKRKGYVPKKTMKFSMWKVGNFGSINRTGRFEVMGLEPPDKIWVKPL